MNFFLYLLNFFLVVREDGIGKVRVWFVYRVGSDKRFFSLKVRCVIGYISVG